MPVNRDNFSPIHVAVVLDADLGQQTLRGVDVFEAGTLVFTTVNNDQLTAIFPEVVDGGCYPATFESQIKSIDTGTDIPVESLLGFH